ncbi:hypothetical protein C8R44DRAFT_728631 [Mycena epipterygia]|nr:hypothetical protein C8R44DRAFT_728631 [Mycena epipterygia]
MFFCEESDRLRNKHTAFALGMSACVPDMMLVLQAMAITVLQHLVFNQETVYQTAKPSPTNDSGFKLFLLPGLTQCVEFLDPSKLRFAELLPYNAKGEQEAAAGRNYYCPAPSKQQ